MTSRLVIRIAAATAIAAAAAWTSPAAAREWRVAAGTALPSPQAAVAVAAPGDTIRVAPGVYRGPLRVDRPLRLVGEGWPVLDGGGQGTVVELSASGARLEGFVVRGSGSSLEREDAGVLVTARDAAVVGNRFEDVLFGISVQEAPGTVVVRNAIRGKALDIARRGDASRVGQSCGARVEGNVVEHGRDVVLWYSNGLAVRGNRVERSRYGLHFMYCDDAEISGNVLADNSVGAFLMYSRRLRFLSNTVAGNAGPSGYGLGLKDMDAFEVRGNRFVGNRVGIFLDGSPQDRRRGAVLAGNLLAAGEVGVRLLPNVGGLRAFDNSFVENGQQVELAGGGGDPAANRWRGNHWSDYVGFDAKGDGVGDVPYRADRLFEDLADRRPELRLLALSPASRALDFAARAFPIVRPQPKLEDPAPRLQPLLPQGAPALAAVPEARVRPALAGSLLLASLALLVAPGRLRRRRASGLELQRERTVDMSKPQLVEVRGLGKTFGSRAALADVSFTIAAGESVALWGANGAGKTTLLRALLGVMPFTGEARVAGCDVRRQGREARRLIGFVPQEIAFPEMTAGEALTLFARLHGADLARIPELVERLKLGDELDKRVKDLSGGRKQRLALAAALVADPPLLLLDEPSSSLDVAARRELAEVLLALKEEGKTLIFSSHRPDEVAQLADRVLHFEEGRLLADLPPLALLHAEVAAVVSTDTAARTLPFPARFPIAPSFVPKLVPEVHDASSNGHGA